MSDLVSRVLAAIEAKEKKAQRAIDGIIRWDATPEMADFIDSNDPAAVLRRCAADKALVALHAQDDTDRRWECGLCGPEGQNIDCTYPCDTLRLLAQGYGISVEEETTGEQA